MRKVEYRYPVYLWALVVVVATALVINIVSLFRADLWLALIPISFQSALLVSLAFKLAVARLLTKIWAGVLLLGTALFVVSVLAGLVAGLLSPEKYPLLPPHITLLGALLALGGLIVGLPFLLWADRCIVLVDDAAS